MEENRKRGRKPRVVEPETVEAQTPQATSPQRDSDRISISRAIGRMQVIEKRMSRLTKEVGERAYVVSNTIIPGFTKDSITANHKELAKHITSSQQELMDLVIEATKLRKAIAESNNRVVLEIGNFSMTVAQWIYFQHSIAPYLSQANLAVERSYERASSNCEAKNQTLRSALNGQSASTQDLMGNEYTVEMVIPENIREALSLFSNEFIVEIKTRIHESNSLEMIEI